MLRMANEMAGTKMKKVDHLMFLSQISYTILFP